MDCHESLMQRRRKRNRGVAAKKQTQPNMKLDKSLPSLPPEEAEQLARATDDPAADAYADVTTEVASRGAAPALDAGRALGGSGRVPDDQGALCPEILATRQ